MLRMQKLHDVILKTSKRLSDKVCFQLDEQGDSYRLSYGELHDAVQEAACYLIEMGVCPEDRIILLAENRPEAMIAYLAILQAAATVVLIDPAHPKADLKNFISQVDARVILVSQKCLDLIDPSFVPLLAVRNIQQGFSPCDNYHASIPLAVRSTQVGLPSDGDPDVATILFTSGTSGHAKGVMLTHDNLRIATESGKAAIQLTEDDKMMTFLPIHHISPLLQNLVSLYTGVTLIFVEKLDGPTILATLQRSEATYMGAVPLLLDVFLKKIEDEIAKQPKRDQLIIQTLLTFSRVTRQLTKWNIGFYVFHKIQKAFGGHLKCIVSGGAAAKPSVVAKLEAFGFTIQEAYGLTETSGPISANRLGRTKPGTAGLPYSAIQIRIVDQEIQVKGPLVMKGYFRQSAATQEVIQAGWFCTGDQGHIDRRGYLKITGRTKEMIVLSSGKKAIPSNIEEQYQKIPGVSELAVFGLSKSGQKSEQIAAAIVLDKQYVNETLCSEKQIEDMIYQRASQLPAYLQIQAIYFVDELPKTAMQKVKRALLKNQIEQNIIEKKLVSEAASKIVSSDKNIRNELRYQVSQTLGLKLEELEDDADFYELGMNSLMAMELISRIENSFGYQCMTNGAAIFEYRTINRLSDYIEKNADELGESTTMGLAQSLRDDDLKKIENYVDKLLKPSYLFKLTKKIVTSSIYFLANIIFKIKIIGVENIPKNEPVIFCANHASFLDGLVLTLATKNHLKSHFVALAAEDYFDRFQFITLLGDLIPFDRTGNEYALRKNFKYIELCQRAKKSFVLFPEGTRSKNGKLQDFKLGAAWLAEKTGLKVVPVYIDKTHQLLPPGNMFPKPGKLSVTFGEPLSIEQQVTSNDIESSSLLRYQDFTVKLRSAIAALSMQ